MGTLSSELAPHAERLSPRPRIYADANVPAGLVAYMRQRLQWDVLFVLEEDELRRAPDVHHYRLAHDLRRTLVTMDRDYLDDRRFPPDETSGVLVIQDLSAYLLNEWALIQFAHNQAAALVTGTFVITAVGAFYALRGEHREQASMYLRHGSLVGLAASILVAFPTGDAQAKIVAKYQEPALAAMEGRFETGPMAEITVIGQPNVKERRLDNPTGSKALLRATELRHPQRKPFRCVQPST